MNEFIPKKEWDKMGKRAKGKIINDRRNKEIRTEIIKAKYPSFYCTVCKMRTWTFHEHNGLNTSLTKKKAKKSEISKC